MSEFSSDLIFVLSNPTNNKGTFDKVLSYSFCQVTSCLNKLYDLNVVIENITTNFINI